VAVHFYGKGDHPAGFVGFRVATSLSAASEFRMKYFSLDEFGMVTGSSMAHGLEAQWRAAMLTGTQTSKRSDRGPGALADGLSAMFRIGKPRHADEAATATPVFVVRFPGYGRGQKEFRISQLGYDCAFSQAIEYYAHIHCLSEAEKKILSGLKPHPDLFLHTLRLELLRRGIIITAARVERMLSGEQPQ